MFDKFCLKGDYSKWHRNRLINCLKPQQEVIIYQVRVRNRTTGLLLHGWKRAIQAKERVWNCWWKIEWTIFIYFRNKTTKNKKRVMRFVYKKKLCILSFVTSIPENYIHNSARRIKNIRDIVYFISTIHNILY